MKWIFARNFKMIFALLTNDMEYWQTNRAVKNYREAFCSNFGIYHNRLCHWRRSFTLCQSEPGGMVLCWFTLCFHPPSWFFAFLSPAWERMCVCMLNRFSPLWLFVILRTVACQDPRSMGILQARILEWVAKPSLQGSSQPRDRTQVSHIASGFFTSWATGEAYEYWSG